MTMQTEGMTHTSSLVVTEAHTAQAVGSGDLFVLSTPSMLALMENAAMEAVAPALAPNETTVGGHIDAIHLRPTPVGITVSATARVTAHDGRKITFTITAQTADGQLIGKATHTRFVIDRERFMKGV